MSRAKDAVDGMGESGKEERGKEGRPNVDGMEGEIGSGTASGVL